MRTEKELKEKQSLNTQGKPINTVLIFLMLHANMSTLALAREIYEVYCRRWMAATFKMCV